MYVCMYICIQVCMHACMLHTHTHSLSLYFALSPALTPSVSLPLSLVLSLSLSMLQVCACSGLRGDLPNRPKKRALIRSLLTSAIGGCGSHGRLSTPIPNSAVSLGPHFRPTSIMPACETKRWDQHGWQTLFEVLGLLPQLLSGPV